MPVLKRKPLRSAAVSRQRTVKKHRRTPAPCLIAIFTALWISGSPVGATTNNPGWPEPTSAAAEAAVVDVALAIFSPNRVIRYRAIDWLQRRGNPDAAAALISALRFANSDSTNLERALAVVSGDTAEIAVPFNPWYNWMLWQQKNPQIKPFEGFDEFKAFIIEGIDPEFGKFVYPSVPHRIRLEEVVWGGVAKDGIPALDNPALIDGSDADYINDDDLVFGMSINGDSRAYPLRIVNWHEMVNDVVGGIPVSLAYCTLCGAGILFETTVAGHDEPFTFGSSGLLFRSNKLMYDRATNSLWNQYAYK